MINEAAARKAALTAQLATETASLAKATRRLKFSKAFIARIFLHKRTPELAKAAEDATAQLEHTQSQLDGCYVEVDFAFDEATRQSYVALLAAFQAVCSSNAIWDVTSSVATNRVAERTIASQSITRVPVRFQTFSSTLIRSSQPSLRLTNATGANVEIYPAFLMMRDNGGDFALIEFAELHAAFGRTRFVETEPVPSDSEVVGQTWAKANKDGSPDRRFNDNYAIPIVGYGELILRSPTGLHEAYMFSNYPKAAAFGASLDRHRSALQALSRQAGEDTPPPADADIDLDHAEDDAQPLLVVTEEPPRKFLADWIVLIALVCTVLFGGAWLAGHSAEIGSRLVARPIPPSTPVPIVAPPPPRHPAKAKTRRPRPATAASPSAQTAPQEASQAAAPEAAALPSDTPSQPDTPDNLPY